MLDFRLKAYRKWLTMAEPAWSDNRYPAIDFQDLSYYSAPKQKSEKVHISLFPVVLTGSLLVSLRLYSPASSTLLTVLEDALRCQAPPMHCSH